jgi:hypothetical protein
MGAARHGDADQVVDGCGVLNQARLRWGQAGDVPAAGDYDGYRKNDFAVFRPSTGLWAVVKSSGGSFMTSFGQAGDVPVPGDYDGDGRTDLAIWRPSTGTWWITNSSTGTVRSQQWGQSGDQPDGDGRADLAVWRPATGTWWIVSSITGGARARQWGAENAVTLDRKRVSPAFLPNLAGSLRTLAIRLSELDRRAEALVPAEEAVTLLRNLAATNAAFGADVAAALRTLADILDAAGQIERRDFIRNEIREEGNLPL